MKLLILMLIAGVLSAGCAAMSRESGQNPLAQADGKMATGDYSGARALYSDFASTHPKDPQAERARATRVVLDRLLTTHSELERLQRERSDQQKEADRLKGEVAKLRADLERLRDIDLQERPRERK